MPAPADRRRPVAMPQGEPERLRWRREFRDALDRPMSGSVTLYPTPPSTPGPGAPLVATTPVTLPIVEGVAEGVLNAGTYTVAEQLVNADDIAMPYGGSYTITLP